MPFQFQTQEQIDSKAAPGVVFSLRKMTERRRAERELQLAPLRSQYSDLYDVLKATEEDAKTSPEDAALLKDMAKAANEMSFFAYKEWYPAWIRWAFSKVDGLEIDGEPADLEKLIQEGPDELIREAVEIAMSGGLSQAEQKNSQSPGGLADQASMETKTTTAGTANDTPSTTAATATNTSPTT